VGETAEVGDPAEGHEEALVVSTLPVLRVSSEFGVAVAREKAKGLGGEPVDTCCPLGPGGELAGNRLARA